MCYIFSILTMKNAIRFSVIFLFVSRAIPFKMHNLSHLLQAKKSYFKNECFSPFSDFNYFNQTMIEEEQCFKTHIGKQNSEKYLAKLPEDFFVRELETNISKAPLSLELLGSKSFLCVGSDDGVISVLSASKMNVQCRLVNEDRSPVMDLAASAGEKSGIRNAVMSVQNGGTMQFWHATSERLLFFKKYEYPLQSCAISPNDEWYAISGENGQMFLGHLNKGEPKTLETGHLGAHGNRVFCIKWNPKNSNIFYSGGWDKTVFFWDVRTRKSYNKLYGIYMGGQAIDYRNQLLLLGNNQNQNQLKLYDIRADRVSVVRWEHYNERELHSVTGVNSCFFGETSEDFVVLSAQNQLRLIREESCMSVYSHPDSSAQGFSMVKNNKQIVTGWSNGDIKVFNF